MAEADDTKPCPYCGEPIKRVALRCKHCQADLKLPDADFDRGVPAGPPREPGHDFEVRFLEFAYATHVTLNVPSVAHALKLPTQLVSDKLEDMAARDVLVREIDDEGNVYFTVPGRPPRPNNVALTKLAPPGQMVHVSAPAESTAVAAMVLNVVLPGVGSLVGGRVSTGVGQMVLWSVGIILSFVLVGLPIALAAWVWSVVTGVHILEESRRRQQNQG